MGQERRAFDCIERCRGNFRAQYVGRGLQRYEALNLSPDRTDAGSWPAEAHHSIPRQEWRPPAKAKGRPNSLDTLAGYARHCLAARELTPQTRERLPRLLQRPDRSPSEA